MKKYYLYCKIFFLAVVILLSVISVSAADRYSVTSGSWNSTATWSVTSGGASGASVPVAGDNVFLENGCTVTITANAACTNITFTGIGAAAILTVNASFTLSISGTITLNELANANSACTLSGGGTLSCANLEVGSGLNAPTNDNTTRTHTFISSIAFLNISGNLSINSYFANFNRIRNGVFNLTSGVVTVNGSITTINANSNNISTFSMATGAQSGTLILSGATPFSLSGTGTNNITLNGTSSLVNYARSGDQTVYAATYTNLTISGSGNKTMLGNSSVNGTLTLTAGTFTVGANTLTLNGPTIAGTPTNLVTTAASSLIFGGTTAGVLIPTSAANLNNLTINNASGVTLSGNVTVSNTLTMTQGNVTTGAFTLALSNGIVSSLTHVSGTVIGRLRRAINTTLSTDYIFPVGTAAFYRPAIMNFSSLSAGTDITAEFIAIPPAGFAAYTDGIANLDNTFTEGYWRFLSSGLPAATYTLNLTGSGFISYIIDEATRITGRDNGNTTWRALGFHGYRSGNDISRSGVTNLNTTSFDFALATGCVEVILGYLFERNISIDYTKVAGGSDLYNFPLLVNLTGQNFLRTSPAGQIINVNGFDITFTDNNYNLLDHQLEYYNGTNGDLIAWVRIPILSSSSNTVIKILYGNPQITTDPSVTSVWDSHYKGVWHLDNNSLNDFTSFNKAGTPYNSPTYPAGRIYNSLGMNGTNQYVEVINDPNINFAGNITVSAWVNMNAGGRDQKIAGNQNNSSGGYKFGIYTNNKVEFEIRNAANTPSLNRDVPGGTVLSTGQWYYLAGISSDVLDSIKTFVNGIPERPFKKTGILGTASDKLTIGKEPWLSSYYFSGMFDELRISDEVRSNGWMRTEYNNQSSPSTFYALDAVGVPSNNLPSEGFCTGPITLTFGYPTGGDYSGNPYIVGNVFTPTSAGTYSITYTYNGGCSPTSITKTFIMTDIPPAPVAPDKEYCISQIAYLEATSGENIRWYSGGTLVSTANPYSTGQTAAGTYNYTVTQTLNDCESAPTAVSLTLFNGISINTQPQPSTICEGENATFTVAASGYNLTYQWQEDGVNISNGGIYSDATTSTLTLTNPGIAKSGKLYRCVVSSSCGTSPVNSSTALLTVNALPVATFSYAGTPYCPNAANPSPTFSGGGVPGTFSSTAGLVFVSTATGEVDISASTRGSYIVTNTIAASGGCGIVIATSPISIISDLIWTGTVSTDWNTTGNWSCGFIPVSTMNVQIPNIANKPVLGGGAAAAVNNLVINISSSLTVTGNSIQISGTITNNGTFTTDEGIVEMNGSAAQVIGADVFNGNTIMDLIINNPAGVTIQGPLNITGTVKAQSGDLSSGGFLTLISTAAQTALIDGSGTGQVNDNVTMQRYLPSGFGYKYFSSPFQAATVNDFADDITLGYYTFYRYDESRTSSGWVSYHTPTTNPLIPLEGYAVNFGAVTAPNTADITGVVNNGSLSFTLYNNNNTYTKGFNLLGNPYPSPIDWYASSGWIKTNIDDALYYFKASTIDQYGGNYSTFIEGISSDGLASNIIPTMQGFFVHVKDGTYPVTGMLQMNNNVRVTDQSQSFIKGEKSVSLLRFTASFSNNLSSPDYCVVYFDQKATNEFDGQLDALKLMNTDLCVPNVYVVTPSGRKISIKACPYATDTTYIIPLGLKINQAGDVIFRIHDIEGTFSEMRISLIDNVIGTEQDLLNNQEYKVSLSVGEYQNRFFLNFSNSITDIPDNFPGPDLFSIYYSKGVVKVKINNLQGGEGSLMICNLLGQTLYIHKIYGEGYHEFSIYLKDGIYITTFISGTKRSSKKIFIQNQ